MEPTVPSVVLLPNASRGKTKHIFQQLSDAMKAMGRAAILASGAMDKFRFAYRPPMPPVALKPAHTRGRHRGWRSR